MYSVVSESTIEDFSQMSSENAILIRVDKISTVCWLWVSNNSIKISVLALYNLDYASAEVKLIDIWSKVKSLQNDYMIENMALCFLFLCAHWVYMKWNPPYIFHYC